MDSTQIGLQAILIFVLTDIVKGILAVFHQNWNTFDADRQKKWLQNIAILSGVITTLVGAHYGLISTDTWQMIKESIGASAIAMVGHDKVFGIFKVDSAVSWALQYLKNRLIK